MFSTGSDYAANMEAAIAADPAPRAAATETMRKVDTPTQKTCEDVAALLGIDLQRTVKSVALIAGEGKAQQFVLALVRGDHEVNEIKLAGRRPGRAALRQRGEIAEHLGSVPGFLARSPRQTIRVVADREVAAMADVVGANEAGFHLAGVNWGRDLPEPEVADIRNVRAGDRAVDGGELKIARGIEVGHVFQLGRKYAEALDATVLDENGKAAVMAMGCYGIGISRVVAAAIEQNHDDAHHLAGRDGAVAGGGVRDQPEGRCGRGRRRCQPAAGAARRGPGRCTRRPRPAPGRDVRRHGADRYSASRGGQRTRPGRWHLQYRSRRASDAENLDKASLLQRLQGLIRKRPGPAPVFCPRPSPILQRT